MNATFQKSSEFTNVRNGAEQQTRKCPLLCPELDTSFSSSLLRLQDEAVNVHKQASASEFFETAELVLSPNRNLMSSEHFISQVNNLKTKINDSTKLK